VNLRPEQEEALRQLLELWRDTPFVLIGAGALGLQVDLARQTNDLDFALSVALEEYPAGLQGLVGWQRRREGEHAWQSPEGAKVDIVPAGPSLLEAGSLIWPQSGHHMSLIGLRLAFEHYISIAIDDAHSIRVAVVPVVFVLKMVSFLDRPTARERDLNDIATILENYLGPTHDRRWELPVNFENASAFAVGFDVGLLINRQEREAVMKFIARAKDENDRTHALLIRNGPWSWRARPEMLFDRLKAFEEGIRRAATTSRT